MGLNPPCGRPARKPDWLRTRLPSGRVFEQVSERVTRHHLHTVCTSARCPNLAECWNRGTATFMLLGDTCTRHCRFCAVATGRTGVPPDPDEPRRVARVVCDLGLGYVVLTSVDRDDLPDLGAGQFVAAVEAVRRIPGDGAPDAGVERRESGVAAPRVEVLVPDFGARAELIRLVAATRPDVYGHNVETVRRLTPQVRDPRASYDRSLAVFGEVRRAVPGMTTKSGLMVGLGETDGEVSEAMRDLRSAGCDVITIGQYLRPDGRCLPVERYVEPARFDRWTREALDMGFRAACCGPLVRSSYRAAELAGTAR